MPTTKAAQATEDLREEVETLRKDMAEMMKLLQSKGSTLKDELSDTLEETLENYQAKAQQSAEDLYEKGSDGLEGVGQQIKQHPIASLAIAFGAGYLISKLMGQGK